METIIRKIKPFFFFIIAASFTILFFACSDDNEEITQGLTQLSIQEKEALLFMLEEEKMARDVYTLLYEQWQSQIFNNIGQSETSHMSAVSNLLDYYNIEYEILGYGEFKNENIKLIYEQLISNGNQSLLNAYIVGASIEDLDIYDLQQALNDVEKDNITSAFESLQCGSRNHLRAFSNVIENLDGNYSPQYITQSEYESIKNSNNENCN
jgi:hypothetical protein